MTFANWKTQARNNIQSLLFNNQHRVIHYLVRDGDNWRDRAETPPRAVRLYEMEADSERTCLQTIQFVHHMLIPPGGRHVAELHVHPDAEELVVITQGCGEARIGGKTRQVTSQDVLYVGPDEEHVIHNTGQELLGVLFINVPVGEALERLRGEVDPAKR